MVDGDDDKLCHCYYLDYNIWKEKAWPQILNDGMSGSQFFYICNFELLSNVRQFKLLSNMSPTVFIPLSYHDLIKIGCLQMRGFYHRGDVK